MKMGVFATISEISIGIFLVVYWYAEALFRLFIPPPMKSIDGEIILVTGAAGGIGREICRNLVKCGSDLKLVLWDVNNHELDKLAVELKSSGVPGLEVYPFAVDVSSRAKIDVGCKQVKNTVGNPTIIFNNAGVAKMGNFLQLTNEEIEETMDINLMSHFWILRQFLPEMVANNSGHIINTCSVAGLKAGTHLFPYVASKFAVNGYTEALKGELRLSNYQLDGIKFTTVYPYFTQTPIIGSLALNPKRETKLPFGLDKFRTPEEVGKKMVNGMRRDYEYIYIPYSVPFVALWEYILPLKLRRALDARFMNSKNFILKDPEEQKRIVDMPYLVAAANSSSKKVSTRKEK